MEAIIFTVPRAFACLVLCHLAEALNEAVGVKLDLVSLDEM